MLCRDFFEFNKKLLHPKLLILSRYSIFKSNTRSTLLDAGLQKNNNITAHVGGFKRSGTTSSLARH